MLKGKQLLCILLSAVLLIVSAGPVFAAENEPAIPQEQAAEVTRVEEIVAWRETDSETYLLSDGTYECVIYAGDKYYRDATNTLQLIDNSIILDAETAQTTNRQYKNAANAFALSFSESEKPEITLAQAGKSITFSALTASGGNSNHITMDDTVVRVGGVQNCAILNEMTDTGDNTITYSNAFYNSDLVYVVKDHSLKEYIILENIHAPNTFSFLFEMEGLTLESFGDAARFVDDTGNPVFTLDSLFAVDANGVLTEDLTYDFFPVKDTGDVIVTVILDETFLQAEDRAFPVVIDPTLMISSVETADACVCSNHPNTNYQSAFQLRTGYDGNDYGIRRSYIRFNIPDTIAPNSVTSARLDLEKISGAAPTIKASQCVFGWSSSHITWSSQVGGMYPSEVSVPYRTGSSWYVMDVTETVQRWVNGDSNYGFLLQDITEDDPNHWTTFYSSDADSPHKPELHITYKAANVHLQPLYCAAYDNMYADQSSRIMEQMDVLADYYYTEFGLEVIVSIPYEQRCYADDCSEEPYLLCPHNSAPCLNSDWDDADGSSEQTLHHTNLYNILYRIPTPDDDYSVNMLYSGHGVCFIDEDGVHRNGYLYGLAYAPRGIAVIANHGGMEKETITAIHEFGHFYGIYDHLDPTPYPYDEDCIYGSNWENFNTLDSIVICQGCRNDLLENIRKYGD